MLLPTTKPDTIGCSGSDPRTATSPSISERIMTAEGLSRQALRLAMRKSQKAGRPLTREEVMRLKVQTVAPWKRWVFVVSGLVPGAIAFACYWTGGPAWVCILFSLCSLLLIAFGIFGKRKHLDRELKKFAADGPTAIVDGILNALTDAV